MPNILATFFNPSIFFTHFTMSLFARGMGAQRSGRKPHKKINFKKKQAKHKIDMATSRTTLSGRVLCRPTARTRSADKHQLA